jgi:eukaryotic-like serine/threonine-protein kinase
MSASQSKVTKELYEFESFQVDPEKETVVRAGKPVPLTPKTFQILLVLIRSSQEVVTKDELMKAVWPDTFVEEANLSRNIFMLRKALGETAQDHRYIVTVPGRGYRFAESVRLVPEQELTVIAASRSLLQLEVKETKLWLWIALAAVLLVTCGVGVWRFVLQRRPILSAKDTVVLADFANSTGDPVFDGTLRQGMAVELEQSPFLSLVSEDRIRRTLVLMGSPADSRLTSEISGQICQRLGSAAVIDGSIARIGSQYVLGIHAANCHTGETLDDEQVQVGKKEDIIGALTHIARSFRSRTGESLATIKKHTTPLAEATTPSLDALKAYSTAWKLAFSNPQDALLLLQRATQIDPDFVIAYALQGRLYADIWESVLSEQSMRKAWELRSHASDRERFFIEVNYQDRVSGNIDKTREVCQVWAQTYPRDALPHGELTWIYQERGNYEESVEEARRAIDLDPDFTPGYNNLAWAYIFLNRLDAAEDALQRASARKLEMPEMLVMRYYIAFLNGDKVGMERAASQAQGQFGAEDWIADEEASVLAWSGQLKQSRMMSNRAVNLALHGNQRERAAMYEAGAAVREALFGNVPEARRRALAARELSNGRHVEWGAALALTLSGDYSQSQRLMGDLDKRFPEDTYVQLTYLPMLRALLTLREGDPAKALQQLQPAAPYDLAVPGSWSGFFGNLYPIYFRGSAYLANRQSPEATAEFQKVLDHRAIVFSDPIGALAHLQLGRALALAGNKTRAKAAYEGFFILWKNADRDLPILRQARSESAHLN